MSSMLRDRNITVAQDTVIFGNIVTQGTKIIEVSSVGEYNGFKMCVPPPEFEALFLDHSLSAAVIAKNLKRKISVTKSDCNGMLAIENTEENYKIFFEFSQNFMASIAFSISAIESWANNTIQSYVDENNQPKEIEIEVEENGKKKSKREFANLIPRNQTFSISRKLFKVIPKVLNSKELSEHSKLRNELKNIINERNTIMHMQDDAEQRNKINFAVSMYKREDFYPVDLMIKYLRLMYKDSNKLPLWIEDLINKRKTS